MSMQIINGIKIGDKFKSAVASLVTFTPTETISGDNVQSALESVDSDIRKSIVTGGDDESIDVEVIDADTLGGRYSATDIATLESSVNTISANISDLEAKPTLLWSGSLTVGNTATLSDSINNYKIIKCLACVSGNSAEYFAIDMIVGAAHNYANSITAYSSGWYSNYAYVTLASDTKITFGKEYHYNWNAPAIVEIYGIK